MIEGIHSQKRHDGNEHGFWLLCHEKRYKLNQGTVLKHLL
jgi:hypothetical protein